MEAVHSGVVIHPEYVNAMIPVFEPKIMEAKRWIRNVERFGVASGCSNGLLLNLAVMRLGKTGKLWYEMVEESIESWSSFKIKLVEWFSGAVDEADVHAELMQRAKTLDETYEDFAFDIISKAKRVRMSDSAIMKYIIQGIPHPLVRSILSTTFYQSTEELVSALRRIEGQESFRKKMNMDALKSEEDSRVAENEYQVYNSKCSEYHNGGRISNPMSRQSNVKTSGHFQMDQHRTGGQGNHTQTVKQEADFQENYVYASQKSIENHGRVSIEQVYFGIFIRFNNHLVSSDALFDTGSPICLIKNSLVPGSIQYRKLSENLYVGLNNSKLNVLGYFDTEIVVNNFIYNLQFKIVPDSTMRPMCILGSDFVTSNNLIVEYDGRSIQFASKNRLTAAQTLNLASATDGPLFEINNIEVSTDTFLKTDVDILDIGDSGTSLSDTNRIKSLFIEMYGNSDLRPDQPDIEHTMRIDLTDNRPFNFCPRRLSHSQKIEVESQIDKLLKEGIITESNSPYASRIVLVKKKDKTWRMCVDYRELNKITVKDRYPLPLIEEQLDSLKNKKYFSTLDLRNERVK
ncbi:uncharacterized protein LOC134290919 [Aedes albopictus]|uniref:Uncharacterized protein n=1 Tax=Aedes albopictus TaxID=7160 RepID=A0ABM1ZFP6_AEDAL